MKKLLICILALVTVLPLLCACGNAGEENVGEKITLYVYNWGEYISDGSEDCYDTNKEFEAYCREELHLNVSVNYSTFSSNEDMYAKISSGDICYDVLIPSDYIIQRMVGEGLIQALNLDLIPNYANVADEFKGDAVYYEDDDPETVFSVPYMYGVVGIIYNTNNVPEDEENIGSWKLMWDEDYAGDILQFNNSRDAFATALYQLGYSVNDATEAQWREALDLLKEQKNVVQGYVMDEIFNKMQSNSASISAYYAGDFLTMYMENDALEFFYPKEGTNSYIDAMCIPSNSKHVELAHAYINFMCSTEAGVANAEYTLYGSPLTNVREDEGYQAYLEEEVKEADPDDPTRLSAYDIIYGEAAQTVKTEPYLNLPADKLTLVNELWEELKVESHIGVGIYIGCGIILAGLIALGIGLFLRKKRWEKLYD